MDMRILTCGDSALAIEVASAIGPEAADRVSALQRALAACPAFEVVPVYCGVMAHYDPLEMDEAEARAEVLRAAARMGSLEPAEPQIVELPVCYGGALGPDLPELAAHCGLSEQAVIDIHSGGCYRVHMLGFTPGFPYLGGMDSRIAMPRLDSPRSAIPWGSVGIAGEQTGIYPSVSPGGWRLIGRSPTRLFDPATGRALLAAGMILRFRPIGPDEYRALGGEPL